MQVVARRKPPGRDPSRSSVTGQRGRPPAEGRTDLERPRRRSRVRLETRSETKHTNMCNSKTYPSSFD